VTTRGYIPGSENNVCDGDLGVILTLNKNPNVLKYFNLENIGENLLYANYSKRSTSQISCSIVLFQHPPNIYHLPVRCCTDPFGAAYSNVQVIQRMSNW
jgi:hypothetical protein